MKADPSQIEAQARRLATIIGDHTQFRLDPQAAVTSEYGIEVQYRQSVSSDCDIDGSYDHDRCIISVDAAAVATRRRFTILHELAHALGRIDGEFQDWLFQFETAGRLEEERVANAFAGLILLPDDLVSQHIPAEGPCAADVQRLAADSSASREAACVRAAQKLRGAGMVTLSQGSTVQLAINRGLPFAIRRGTDMGSSSVFAEASRKHSLRRSGVRIRFPQSRVESSMLEADAVTDETGYTFTVLMAGSAPWVPLTAISSAPLGHEIDCQQCDRARLTFKPECQRCGDRPCPEHGCSCRARQRAARVRRCRVCNTELPVAERADVILCYMCG